MSTIKQKTATVGIEGGPTYIVRRMAWKPHKEFLREIALLLASTMQLQDSVSAAPEERLAGLIRSVATRLPALLDASEKLTEHLLVHSAGLKPEEIDTLDAALVAELINQGLACNFDDEIKNSFAGIVAAVMGALPAHTASPKTT